MMLLRRGVTSPQKLFDIQLGLIRLLTKVSPPNPAIRRKQIETDERLMELELAILRTLDGMKERKKA